MTYWRVYLNGGNFWLKVEGEPKRLGFYTTRYVEADNAGAAEKVAVQMLREEEKLQGVLNDPSDPPMIYAEDVSEVELGESIMPHVGYTFYLEEDDS